MALAAVKTFIDAEPLFASDLNALDANIRNNALALVSPLTGNLDVDGHALINIGTLRMDDTLAAPATSGYFARNGIQMQWFDGSRVQSWRPMVTGLLTSAPVATTGTVEETLWTFDLQNLIYNRTGWALQLRTHWITAANGNQKVLKLRIDDGTPATVTLVDTTANNGHLETSVWIWSTGTSTQTWQSATVGSVVAGTGLMFTPAISNTTLGQTATPWTFSLRGLTPTSSADLSILVATITVEA